MLTDISDLASEDRPHPTPTEIPKRLQELIGSAATPASREIPAANWFDGAVPDPESALPVEVYSRQRPLVVVLLR